MADYTATNTDLVSLIERTAGVDLAKKSNHYKFGDEFAGSCPFCRAGDDRFRVWQGGSDSRAHYWCRVCSATGSAPWFLVQYSGLSFGEACMELGLDPDDVLGNNDAPSQAAPKIYDAAQPPCKEWQEAGLLLVERAEKYLWHPKSVEGQQALAYLRARGFKNETIKAARLGCVPLEKDGSWHSEPFQHWGLDPEKLTEQQRAKGCVRVPNGILIPWLCENQLWKLAIKRPGEQMDYGQVLGSTDGLYNVDSIEMDKPVMLVEGEFDALSVAQEAGDLIACCATGSAQKGRNPRWLADLSLASYKLIAFDNDAPDKNGLKAGDEGAHYWLQLSNSMRWSPWTDEHWSGQGWRFKDPNDMLKDADAFRAWAGTDLRGWVKEGMAAYELPPLTDEEWAKMRPAPAHQIITPQQPLARVELSEEERLERFGEFVSQVVDIFGGADKVTVTKQEPGYTLEQHVKELERQARTEAALSAWNAHRR